MTVAFAGLCSSVCLPQGLKFQQPKGLVFALSSMVDARIESILLTFNFRNILYKASLICYFNVLMNIQNFTPRPLALVLKSGVCEMCAARYVIGHAYTTEQKGRLSCGTK